MLQKSLISALMILSAFALNGCARVKINDHEICADKGELGARCVHMLSAKTRILDFDQWQDERFGQLCLREDGFANLKEAILKLCDSSQRCSWEEVRNLKTVLDRIEELQNGI